MKNKEKEIDFTEDNFKQRFKQISRANQPAITLKDETKNRITIYLDSEILAHYRRAAK